MNRYNSEGYYDPTAYAALVRAGADARRLPHRPLVFICSPYAGDIERNTENARRYCRFAVSKNCIPVAPHLFFPQFLDEGDPEQRSLGISFGLVLQGKCREVWVFGRVISEGMAAEIAKAKARGLPLRYFNEHCREVVRR